MASLSWWTFWHALYCAPSTEPPPNMHWNDVPDSLEFRERCLLLSSKLSTPVWLGRILKTARCLPPSDLPRLLFRLQRCFFWGRPDCGQNEHRFATGPSAQLARPRLSCRDSPRPAPDRQRDRLPLSLGPNRGPNRLRGARGRLRHCTGGPGMAWAGRPRIRYGRRGLRRSIARRPHAWRPVGRAKAAIVAISAASR